MGPSGRGRPRLFYGWVVVGAGLAIMTAVAGISNVRGVFYKPILTDLGWGRGETALGFSMAGLMNGFFSPLMGALADRHGPRLVGIICGSVLLVGFLATSRMESFWQLVVFYGLIVGVGLSAMWAPMASMVARWFEARRGFALAVVQTGGGLGTVVMAPLATSLILGSGWRMAYVVMGTAVGGIVLLAAQFYRASPQGMGLLPDGMYPDSVEVIPLERLEGAGEKSYSLRQAVATGAFRHVALAAAVGAFSHQLMLQHLVANVIDQGINPKVAATLMSVMGLSNIVGKLIMGMISDHIGRKPSLLISLSMAAVMMFWLFLSRDLWMFYFFAAIFGWAYGSWIPMYPALVGDIFGLRAVGAIFGLVLTANFVGGFFGGLLPGYIYDVTGGYGPAFLLAGVLLLVGVVSVLTLKAPKGAGAGYE